MEFLGSVKAKNHQNLIGLSQVNRPMGLWQNLDPHLTLKESSVANNSQNTKILDFSIFDALNIVFAPKNSYKTKIQV